MSLCHVINNMALGARVSACVRVCVCLCVSFYTWVPRGQEGLGIVPEPFILYIIKE